jgi:anti-sigma factor RsiW
MASDELSTPHLTAVDAAAYVDARLPPKERARVDAHVADCAPCRAEIVDISALVSSGARAEVIGPPRSRRLLLPFGLAAAAALALMVYRPPVGSRVGAGIVRAESAAGVPEGVLTIGVVAPAAGDTVLGDSTTLVWASAGVDAAYDATLGTETGSVLWSARTPDTLLVVPEGIRLEPGRTYYWHVDAILPSGISATTRSQSFTVRTP